MSSALTFGLRTSVATDITSAAASAAATTTSSPAASSIAGLMQRGSWISSFHSPTGAALGRDSSSSSSSSSSLAQAALSIRPGGAAAELMRPRSLRELIADKPGSSSVELIRPKSLRDRLLDESPTTAGVEWKRNVEATRPAITAQLVARAKEAGLGPTQAAQLESILKNSKDFSTDAKLVDDLLNTENPARALKTFTDLDIDRRQHPDRITPDVVRALSMGVGEARTSATQGREGILSNMSAVNAANALIHMPQADYDQIRQALNNAGKPPSPGADVQTERALILKAVAARNERLCDYTAWNATGEASPAAGEVTRFADAIRGKDASLLIERTTALDLDGDGTNEALQQKFNDSCAQATLQLARAEADPVYAWNLHHSDVLHNTSTMGTIADEQRQQLEAAGGDAQPRGTNGAGTQIEAISTALNGSVSPTTNRTYGERVIGNDTSSRTKAVDMMELFVKSGTDVPIGVSWNGGGGHALLVTDVRGSGNTREFLVTDPWNGRTDWVSRQDIINGNTNFFAGTGRLSTYWY